LRRRTLLYGKLLRQFSEREEDNGLHPDDALQLQRALNKLGVAERAALLLCDACGMSHGEAAEALSVPLGTLKTRVQRARGKMRQAMDSVLTSEQGQLVSCRTTT
jgi:RNA polymerase sigma-70 factor, ECF subfamily